MHKHQTVSEKRRGNITQTFVWFNGLPGWINHNSHIQFDVSRGSLLGLVLLDKHTGRFFTRSGSAAHTALTEDDRRGQKGRTSPRYGAWNTTLVLGNIPVKLNGRLTVYSVGRPFSSSPRDGFPPRSSGQVGSWLPDDEEPLHRIFFSVNGQTHEVHARTCYRIARNPGNGPADATYRRFLFVQHPAGRRQHDKRN